MAKHRRWSDKQKSESTDIAEVQTSEPQISNPKSDSNLKFTILSGTKYAYIIVASALFCGIFTPLTLGIEVENVIFGILTIFLGLGGGIIIFLSRTAEKHTSLMICGGLGMLVISMILIFELSKRSLFQ
tara:strand:- start:49 stop:435 length:387 start_codon:yes stop_codon:yes gene_type:complete